MLCGSGYQTEVILSFEDTDKIAVMKSHGCDLFGNDIVYTKSLFTFYLSLVLRKPQVKW